MKVWNRCYVKVPGVDAVFHDPAAAIVDGAIVGAAEEERFTRRNHRKPCVPLLDLEAHRGRGALWAGRTGDPHASSTDPGLLEIGVEDVRTAVTKLLRD